MRKLIINLSLLLIVSIFFLGCAIGKQMGSVYASPFTAGTCAKYEWDDVNQPEYCKAQNSVEARRMQTLTPEEKSAVRRCRQYWNQHKRYPEGIVNCFGDTEQPAVYRDSDYAGVQKDKKNTD